MLIVVLTLCGILAVIWWLTGSSRHQPATADPEIERAVATEALTRVAGSPLTAGRKPDSVGRVLYDVLTGVGMAQADAEDTVKGLGYRPPPGAGDSDGAQEGLAVFSMQDELARAAVERAILVGVQLARMDDDYAGVSDEALAFERLRRRADEVEQDLFDDRRRARLDFYTRAGLVLQDQIQSESDEGRRRVMAEVLSRFDEAVRALQEEMSAAMASLQGENEDLAWGDSEDRRRYYFKMGVTNSLRRSGHMTSLGHLYRFRGVNYDVEEAFQMAGEEAPLLLQTANMPFTTLVALQPSDVRRLTDGQRFGRPLDSTES